MFGATYLWQGDLLDTDPAVDMRCKNPQPNRRRGATSIEYAAMLALISAVCVAALLFLGETTSDSFLRVSAAVEGDTDAHSSSPHSSSQTVVEQDENSLQQIVDREKSVFSSFFPGTIG